MTADTNGAKECQLTVFDKVPSEHRNRFPGQDRRRFALT